MMNIVSRYLAREDILLGLDVPGKTRALEEIAAHLGSRHHLRHTNISSALIRREKSGSTAVGHGLAIPHARISGIGEPIVLLARTKAPIKFGAPDHEPVSVMFVIIVPENANEEHLQILGTVAEMFSSEGFREELKSATDADKLHQLFLDWRSGD
jgi:PTS system nitrogen regulatory IIA component